MDLDKYADFAHKKSVALFFAILVLWLLLGVWTLISPKDNFYVIAYAQFLLPPMALGVLLLGFVPRDVIKYRTVGIGAFALFVLLTLALWYAEEYSEETYSSEMGPLTYKTLYPGIVGFLAAGLCGGLLGGFALGRRKLGGPQSISYGGFLLAKAFGMLLVLSLVAGIIMLGFMHDCCNAFLNIFRTAWYLSDYPLEVMFTSFFGVSLGIMLAQRLVGGKRK